VTAYCTASSYRLDDLTRYLKGKTRSRGAAPKRFDECLYTPYRYEHPAVEKPPKAKGRNRSGSTSSHTVQRRYSDSVIEVETHDQRAEDLVDVHNKAGDISFDTGQEPLMVPNHSSHHDNAIIDGISTSEPTTEELDIVVDIPEIFIFDYGTVVIWGMTEQQEHRFLKDISKYEEEKLDKEAVQTEDFNFYYTREYQARIYNDFISLRDKKNYMTKLAISHALSQSVKVSFYQMRHKHRTDK
jgi:uncharacterized Rmd1/YagE family protein